ncbi:MAG: SHOCT domain-containing protein [Actinomycetota bacterium]|nr:SHOCT domain-containing protein [Actinomycetota bacterium]
MTLVSLAASGRPPGEWLRASVAVFATLAGLSCALTLLFLGVRAGMDIGGTCASGGPYVPRVQCPEGTLFVTFGGVWGGLICVGLYLWATTKHRVPSLVGLAWPALFLSLGWNFLEYGIDPPYGDGLGWGWLVCALLFALMGGIPLFAMAHPIASRFTKHPSPFTAPDVLVPTRARVKDLREAHRSAAFGGMPSGPPEGEEADSVVVALERLNELHRSGALSDGEFEAAKQRVLGGG